MNSYRPSNGKKGRRFIAAATAFAVVVIAIDLVSGGAVRSAVRSIGNGIWRGGQSASAALGGSGLFTTRAALETQVRQLSAASAGEQSLSAQLAALQAQNAQLSALVHLSQTQSGITAPVVSSFVSSPYGTFDLGAGSAQGVALGAFVESPDGYVIGRITQVSKNGSQALELFAPGQTLDVLVGSVPFTLQGRGGGVAQGQAPQGASVDQGAVVIAPSLSDRPVGIVGNVQSGIADPATTVLVDTSVNLETLTDVYIVNSQ